MNRVNRRADLQPQSSSPGLRNGYVRETVFLSRFPGGDR